MEAVNKILDIMFHTNKVEFKNITDAIKFISDYIENPVKNLVIVRYPGLVQRTLKILTYVNQENDLINDIKDKKNR